MEGGTYARALNAGFKKNQASFFSSLGAETRDEAVHQIRKEIDDIIFRKTLRYRFSVKLRKWADKFSQPKE